jgi:signal transduction histidine kinase
MISHDVRTPLTATSFGLNALLKEHHGPVPDKQKEVIARAEQSNIRVIGLLNELIDLEKSVDTQLTLELSDFFIHDLLLAGANELSQQAEQMGVEIIIEGSNPAVRADHDRIERVFINLLSNALKHSPAGVQVTISIVVRQTEIEVRVSDKGPGIPKQMQAAVFERYVQLALPDERGPGGSGLGLAICKALIEAHGSAIGVDSEPGKGSTFWFTLARSVQA